MRWKIILLFTVILSVDSLYASSALPIPLATQIKESDAVIFGTFLHQKYKKLPNEKVVTESAIKVHSSVGVPSSFLNHYEFKVLTHGGEWQGQVYNERNKVSFTPNEEVVLFLKKDPTGYWLNHHRIGKYRVSSWGKKKHLISDAFPLHPRVGQISFADFNKKLEKIKGEELALAEEVSPLMVVKVKEQGREFRGQRKIASISEVEKDEEENPSIFWLILFFSLLGGLSTVVLKKQ